MRLLQWCFLLSFHFLMIIFVINNFCIKQTLYQVYSHIKGQCLTILVMFFISLHHHINIFKLNKKQNSWSNDSKCYFSRLPALLKILTLREFQAQNSWKFKNNQAELKKVVSYKKKCTYSSIYYVYLYFKFVLLW